MSQTLRHLLIQRAARLQDRPAFTCAPWETLSYAQLRNRVEGVALGLLADSALGMDTLSSTTATPWDWICELATACCGLKWNVHAQPVPLEILGGNRFNDESGRQRYHDREHSIHGETPFLPGFSHETLWKRLQRFNTILGWDHTYEVHLPIEAMGSLEGRAALWNALYAGAHARFDPQVISKKSSPKRDATFPKSVVTWDPEGFRSFWSD